MRTLRQIHAVVAGLFVATIVYQVYLAGAAIANLGGSGDFSAHAGFGYEVVGLAALAVLITAIIARMPRRDIGLSFLLLVQYVIQTILPGLKGSAPSIAALHPLNAVLLFALATWYARHAWMTRNADRPAAGRADLVPASAADAPVSDAR
jgi:hypothetical protein